MVRLIGSGCSNKMRANRSAAERNHRCFRARQWGIQRLADKAVGMGLMTPPAARTAIRSETSF